MRVAATTLIAILFWTLTALAEEPPKKKGVAKAEEKSAMVKRAEGSNVTNDYVHRWIKFPSGTGKSIGGGENSIQPQDGYVTVVFFVASWDIKSQELLKRFQKLESAYKNVSTHFVYVFTHDTFEDAAAFAADAGITNGIVAGHELHKNFHHPKIPSIYVGDKDGWLSTRYLDTSPKDVEILDEYLRYVTAI
jgi:hypothetical protein